jgi:hypothetical protein
VSWRPDPGTSAGPPARGRDGGEGGRIREFHDQQAAPPRPVRRRHPPVRHARIEHGEAARSEHVMSPATHDAHGAPINYADHVLSAGLGHVRGNDAVHDDNSWQQVRPPRPHRLSCIHPARSSPVHAILSTRDCQHSDGSALPCAGLTVVLNEREPAVQRGQRPFGMSSDLMAGTRHLRWHGTIAFTGLAGRECLRRRPDHHRPHPCCTPAADRDCRAGRWLRHTERPDMRGSADQHSRLAERADRRFTGVMPLIRNHAT